MCDHTGFVEALMPKPQVQIDVAGGKSAQLREEKKKSQNQGGEFHFQAPIASLQMRSLATIWKGKERHESSRLYYGT